MPALDRDHGNPASGKMGITEHTVAVLPWLRTVPIFLATVAWIPAVLPWLPHVPGTL